MYIVKRFSRKGEIIVLYYSVYSICDLGEVDVILGLGLIMYVDWKSIFGVLGYSYGFSFGYVNLDSGKEVLVSGLFIFILKYYSFCFFKKFWFLKIFCVL